MVEAHKAIGKCSREQIGEYFSLAGFPAEYADDQVAWCAAFVGAMIKKSGGSPAYSLLARHWLSWGRRIPIRKNCIAVFSRPGASWTGHVGFVAGFDSGNVQLLGGNQSGCVNVRTYSTARLLGCRWPSNVELF